MMNKKGFTLIEIIVCIICIIILPHWAKSTLTDSFDVGSVPSVTGNVFGKMFDSIVQNLNLSNKGITFFCKSPAPDA